MKRKVTDQEWQLQLIIIKLGRTQYSTQHLKGTLLLQQCVCEWERLEIGWPAILAPKDIQAVEEGFWVETTKNIIEARSREKTYMATFLQYH